MIERAVYTREDIMLQAEEAKKLRHQAFYKLKEKDEDLLDDDGYPTDYALYLIEIWPWEDTKGWFEFIKSIWWKADWGWDEGEEDSEHYNDKKVYRYHISTGGWSGNEDLIRAMEKNDFMWYIHWVQSRRGGHYIFEDRDLGEN